MNEKWYYLAVGVVISAAVFSFIGMSSPGGSLFFPVSETGLIVKQAVREDLGQAKKLNITLEEYPLPFDGSSGLPGRIDYGGVNYTPMVADYDDFKSYAGVLKVEYLLSIGESPDGKFPVYLVRIGEGPFMEGIVILNKAFPKGGEPFT